MGSVTAMTAAKTWTGKVCFSSLAIRLAPIPQPPRATAHALHRFAELPMVVAPAAPVAAGGLFETLAAEPDLGRRVRTAVRVGGRRWDVRLDNGIDVRLPEAGEGRAWRRLAQLERRHALLARRIEAIDLRFPDRVVVRRARAEGGTGKGRE